MILALTPPPRPRNQRRVGPVAQLVEQLTFNQRVTGSNPVRLTTSSTAPSTYVLGAVWFLSTETYRVLQTTADAQTTGTNGESL